MFIIKKITLLAAIVLSGVLTSTAQESNNSPQKVNMWAIDMTPLEVDGELYAIWSGWRDNYERCTVTPDRKGQHLFIAKMTLHDQKPMVQLGDRVELCSYDTYKWENEVGQNIQEGPQVLRNPKTKDIFVIYSVNGSWCDRYKLGQIKLTKGADPLDPKSWVKRDEPVFRGVKKSDNLGYEVYGVGHASFTTSPDDRESWIYYHAKTTQKGGWADRRAYLQKLTFDKSGNPQIGLPEPLKNTMQRPSGECKIDRKRYGIKSPDESFDNPLMGDMEYADPWITKHNGMYYTVRIRDCRAWVTESPYMTRFVDNKGNEISWEEARIDCGWTPPAIETKEWNSAQYWAPEIHNINNRWYIFYAAGINPSAPFSSQRTGVLVSATESIAGPYVEHDDKPLFTGEKSYVMPTVNNSGKQIK